MKPTFVRGSADALGDQGTLKTWKVKPNDLVEVGQVLCEIETPVAILEIETPHSGTIVWLLEEGEVKPGQVIADITPEGEEPNPLNVEHLFAPLEYDDE